MGERLVERKVTPMAYCTPSLCAVTMTLHSILGSSYFIPHFQTKIKTKTSTTTTNWDSEKLKDFPKVTQLGNRMHSKPRSTLTVPLWLPLPIFRMTFIVKTFIIQKAINAILKIKKWVESNLFQSPENYDKENQLLQYYVAFINIRSKL